MSTALNSYVFAELVGFQGAFDKVQGGECQQNITDYIPGGERSARKLPGTYSYADITLARAYDPMRDRAVIEWAKAKIVGGLSEPRTLVKYTRNAQGFIEGKQSYQVVARNYKTPDGVAGDDGVAEFSIVLSVEREL